MNATIKIRTLKLFITGMMCLATILPQTNLKAQDSVARNQQMPIIYTFFLNVVPENFNLPLIGLINIAQGNQKTAQIGLVNFNQSNFQGVQVSYVNTVGGQLKGAQVGFVNTTRYSVRGVQVGYINTAIGKVDGAQIGFVDVSKDPVNGAEVGFVNAVAGNVNGAQVGYVNICKDSLLGTQVGFVNTTFGKVNGSQIGFVNFTQKTMNGFQLGFVNVTDTLEKGIPIGFISIIRHGGYKALEVGYSELYPINVSLKLGVKYFYSSISASFNPKFKNQFAIGYGIGSIIPISKSFYFNPEAVSFNQIAKKSYQMLTLSTNFGYSLAEHWSLLVGPSVNWQYKDNDSKNTNFDKPQFSIYQKNFDNYNRLFVGVKASLRYNF